MENVLENNLFYTCSLIEYISRVTKNRKSYIVEKLGKDTITRIYDLAEVYHSENIDKIAMELITECNIEEGNYHLDIKNNKPTFWEIGKVYQRLILNITNDKNKYIDTLIQVLTSWIIEKIDNYNSSLYYENNKYLYECYIEGKIL